MNESKIYVSNGEQYWEFNSVREAFHYKSPLKDLTFKSIGHNFNDTYIDGYADSDYRLIKVTYVMYDYLWRVISKEVIEKRYETEPRVKSKYFYKWFSSGYNYLGFRNGPVPKTGKKVYGVYNWHRAPKTTQERRLNCADSKYTRGKRRNLRSAWDDVRRSDRNIKQSWKKQKKLKQWM